MSAEEATKKKIVVVGAGASARLVITALRAAKSTDHITVIQPNKFASLPYYQTLVLTKRETFTNNSTFVEVEGSDKTVYGVAESCSDGSLAVRQLAEDGGDLQQVPFDVLVAATGFAVPGITETPGQSKDERQQEIDKIANGLVSGNNVVIAGGGAIGIELAADVLESLPAETRKSKVTLVCSSDKLLPGVPPSFSEKSKQVLEDLGCEIIFNDRVTSHNETTTSDKEFSLEFKSGKTLKCHAYVTAFGKGPRTSYLSDLSVLDDKGKVIVDDYLQATANDKLYAMGATNNRTDASLYKNLEDQSKVIAANILKPQSKKIAPGLQSAFFQIIGHDTFGAIIPENLPLPGPCATLCCTWCGFPCNLLCPCFCAAVVCGPCDAMTCGTCCGKPEGPGFARTMANTKKMHAMAANLKYMSKEEMQRE